MYATMTVLRKVLLVFIVATVCKSEAHRMVEKMFMSRTMGSDLKPEATGYIYRSDSNGPSSYVQLGAGAVHEHLNTFPRAAPLIHPQTYASYGYIPLSQQNLKVPAAPKVFQAPYAVNQHVQESSDDDDEEDEEYDEGVQQHAPVHQSFSSGGGKASNAESHSAHGEKGDKGYKSVASFDKGQAGKHYKDGHKSHYDQAGGHKSGHSDTSNHYAQNHEAAGGHKGGSFGEKKSHAKGHKTTGYHNVFHKDEYKKEHKFYDDAHDSGHHDKHAAFGANHHSAEGGYTKGGKHDSAYNHGSYGKQGFADQGSNQESQKGHANKAGEEAYHSNFSDYAKKGASSDGKEYGYSGKH